MSANSVESDEQFDLTYGDLKEILTCRGSDRSSECSDILGIGLVDGYHRISVTMFEGERAVSRMVEVGKPRFSWFYDLPLQTNINIVARSYGHVAPKFQEIAWIAISTVRFLGKPYWSVYDRMYTSLHRWATILTDLVVPVRFCARENMHQLNVC